jgi:hypothetical protein
VLLLRHLSKHLSSMRVMILGTYRDDELELGRPLTTSIGPLVRDGGAIDLHPRLLSKEEVAAVIAARSSLDAPPELVDLMFAETQGNPYFVEELFRHLRESGRLFDNEGQWRSGFEIGETEVPQGVRLLITQRLERLNPEHRKALASAAVIGRAFAFGDLAGVIGGDEDDLFDALEAAERAHLIEELPADHDARYLFVHEQIRQTLVGELSLARRQRVHLRVADALEATGSGSIVEIAHHLLAAGPAAPSKRTVAALVSAAQANIESLAFEDALRHMDNAERLVDDDGRFELSRMQAGALRGAGRVDDALAVLDAELERTIDGDAINTLRLQRVQLLNDQFRATEGLADIESLLAAAAETDDPDLELAAQLAKGRAHYILSLDKTSHAEPSRDAYDAAYKVAKRRGDKENMARALLPTTWFTDYWEGYGPIAAANAAEAIQLAQELGDEDLLLDAQSAAMHQAGVAVDRKASEALLERLEARRDPVKLNAHCFWMMWQYMFLGLFEESIAACDRGIALAYLIGTHPVQYGSIKAISLIEMGRFDEVAAAIDQEVTDDDHPFGQAMASLARSVYLTRIAAWDPAAVAIVDTIDRAKSLSRVWMQNWARSLLAIVEANLQVAGKSGALHDPGTVPENNPRLGRGMAGLTAAEVALIEGRPDDCVAAAGSRAGRTPDSAMLNRVRALDLVARAHLDLGDLEAAAETATQGLAFAEQMNFASIAWRLRMVRSIALGQPTDEAAAEFRVLADRIAEPELRWWFDRQPLAPH